MDAVMVPVADLPGESHSSEKSVVPEKLEINLAPRMKAALLALTEALDYAHDLASDPWEFAIELANMRRMKMSNGDLRWLVVRGLVEHAVEVTLSDDVHRTFRRPARLLFSKKTCFVLTAIGKELVSDYCGDLPRGKPAQAHIEQPVLALVHPRDPLAPKWDRDRQELRFGSSVVKRFKIPAPAQAAILAAFEEQNWPQRIANPLVTFVASTPRPPLRDLIDALNRNRKQPPIRFVLDDSNDAVAWEVCAEIAAQTTN